MHPLTVEIRDYAQNRIDIYFADALSELLQQRIENNRIDKIFRIFLPNFNAFMVHSSAVIRKDRVVFFLAHDEGGKTSVARQAPAATVIGDDQVILRKQNGMYVGHSTPWGRIVNDPISAPLGAFFIIEKSPVFDLIPLKPKQVIEFLWSEQMDLIRGAPKQLRSKIFDRICEAVHQVPLYQMQTPLNGVDWDRIDACL